MTIVVHAFFLAMALYVSLLTAATWVAVPWRWRLAVLVTLAAVGTISAVWQQ